jgi:hypothetical protein
MKNSMFFLLLLAISFNSFAQDTLFNNKYFHDGLYYFEDTFKMKKSEIFTAYKPQFGLGYNDSVFIFEQDYKIHIIDNF